MGTCKLQDRLFDFKLLASAGCLVVQLFPNYVSISEKQQFVSKCRAMLRK